MHGIGQGCPPFFGEQMAASSVTGVGPGDSNGKQKPELHSGCGCSGSQSQPTRPTSPKKGCYSIYKSCGIIRHKINSNMGKSKNCF
jgi:hypothetical protein